jgi:hypothetical protein
MKIRTTLPIAVVSAAVLLATGPVWAHHSMVAQFSVNKPITLKGTLTKMTWVNPHGWIYMNVTGSEGEVETWAIETGSPHNMVKRGLTKKDFRPGTEIIVGGFAAKDGTRTVAGMIVTFPAREPLGRETSFALGR